MKGNWREDLLFELKSSLSLNDTFCKKIEECDVELEKSIQSIVGQRANPSNKGESNLSIKTAKQMNKHTPKFDIETLSTQYYGVNLMQVPHVGRNTVLCLLTQIGDDIYKFPTSKHFCSWLRLAPNNKITGGKIMSSRTPKGKNKLSLRQAANSIGNQSKGDLVQFFKRIAYRKGRAAAITTTARKLSVILYNMITKKQDYKPAEPIQPSEKSKNKIIKAMKQNIEKLKLSKEQIEFLFNPTSLSVT